jgi:diacylglycerol O-acyltransferase
LFQERIYRARVATARLERLSGDDAKILGLESEAIKGHTMKVAIVEHGDRGKLELDQLSDQVASRLDRAPRTRHRLAVTPLGIAPPAWVEDPHFDLREHVRRVPTKGVVGRERMRAIAGELMAERLDHTRPLWRIDLIGPLSRGRSAVAIRIHHALADGITALRMSGAILWDTSPDPDPVEAGPWRPQPPPGTAALFAAAVRDRAADAGRGLAGIAADLREPSRLLATGRELARMPAALARELSPMAPDSSFDRHIGSRRELAWRVFRLDELKGIAHGASARTGSHVTINDVVLAAVAGGLGSWLREEGRGAGAMRAQIPVSMHGRAESPDELGNRDSFMYVDLPVAEDDPLRRLELVNSETVRRKSLGDPDELYAFFHGLSHLGPLGHLGERLASGPREFSLSVSNVPGPRDPIYIMGRRVAELYSNAEPADRHALRVSAISCAGTMAIGLCTDPDSLSGLDRLANSIERAVKELG